MFTIKSRPADVFKTGFGDGRNKMKIVIPGGSGQVGTILARAMYHAGHEVVILSRQASVQPWRVVPWNGRTLGRWSTELDGSDVVINLAGRSVNCRYTAANRREIVESRVAATGVVAQAIAHARRPPKVWLQASTATIYAHRYDESNDEASGILGGAERGAPGTWKFSIDVARSWEDAFNSADTPKTRKIALRSAMTMSPDPGGIFDVLLNLVRRGLGGKAGDGRQFVSWIHFEDFIRVTEWLIEHDDLSGVINVAAPQPLPNADFMRTLREVSGTRVGLPASRWMLEIGALLMQTETELILKSRRVVPGRLLDHGFVFRFPSWSDAARDLYRQWELLRDSRSRAA